MAPTSAASQVAAIVLSTIARATDKAHHPMPELVYQFLYHVWFTPSPGKSKVITR